MSDLNKLQFLMQLSAQMPREQMEAVLRTYGYADHGMARDLAAVTTFNRDNLAKNATVNAPDGSVYEMRTSWGNTIVVKFPSGKTHYLMEGTSYGKTNEEVLAFLRDKWIPTCGLTEDELMEICDVDVPFPSADNPAEETDDVEDGAGAGAGCGAGAGAGAGGGSAASGAKK